MKERVLIETIEEIEKELEEMKHSPTMIETLKYSYDIHIEHCNEMRQPVQPLNTYIIHCLLAKINY